MSLFGFPVSMLMLLVLAGCSPSQSALRTSQTPEGFLVTEGGSPVLLYRHRPVASHGAHARAHYLHPLYGLNGEILTEDAPEDHLHQHGIYWAWHQVYVGGRRVGDGWTQEDIHWNVRDVDEEDGRIRARVLWSSPRYLDSTPFLEETATITVLREGRDYREIDFVIELQALVDSVRLGGSEDPKGYGGFSARIRMPEDLRFHGPEGEVEPIETEVNPGPWVDVAASFSERTLGLAILQHPSNPGYPQPWILRRSGSMQNAKWPGEEPVLIPRDQPLTLRYRLVMHDGSADLNRLHDRYAAL